MSAPEKLVNQLLNLAGVTINGSEPWDIQIHDQGFFKRVASNGSLGLGEAYMDGMWSCQAVDAFIAKLLSAKIPSQLKKNWHLVLHFISSLLFNQQTIRRSQQVAEVHYNLDNNLYQDMLGATMSYTCAYWKGVDTLDSAQAQKHDLICRKLDLKPGDQVLELGCGFGGFAKFAAEHYGCHMVSVNISEAQLHYAQTLCQDLPVKLHLCDYRDVKTYNPHGILFDKVVSIGLCEHIGYKNYSVFLDIVKQNLKDHGLFLLHSIGGNKLTTACEPWTNKYIFPHGVLPSIRGLGQAMEGDFVMEDWHNFGVYYDHTLMAWYENFNKAWDRLKSNYDERFYRMWSYYLLSCAGMFRSRSGQLWQIVMSKHGLPGGYESIR